ncbi:hypothetical protein ACOME3_004146 [Neoechinorhynchus agilis]
MQIVLSFAFFLFMMPYYLHWMATLAFKFRSYCRSLGNLYEDVQMCMGAEDPVWTGMERVMRDVNHSLHFILYYFTSPSFRKDFMVIFLGRDGGDQNRRANEAVDQPND